MRIHSVSSSSNWIIKSKALIQYRDEGGARWCTVKICVDTPTAISAAIKEARREYPGYELWVYSSIERTRYLSRKEVE